MSNQPIKIEHLNESHPLRHIDIQIAHVLGWKEITVKAGFIVADDPEVTGLNPKFADSEFSIRKNIMSTRQWPIPHYSADIVHALALFRKMVNEGHADTIHQETTSLFWKVGLLDWGMQEIVYGKNEYDAPTRPTMAEAICHSFLLVYGDKS